LPIDTHIKIKNLIQRGPIISREKLFSKNINKHLTIIFNNGQTISGILIDWFNSGETLYIKTDQKKICLCKY